MRKYVIQYVDVRGEPRQAVVVSDDEACAIGSLLDLYGDQVSQDSPFLVRLDVGRVGVLGEMNRAPKRRKQ